MDTAQTRETIKRDVAGTRRTAPDCRRRGDQLGTHHCHDLDLALPFLIGSVIGVAGVIVLSTFLASTLPRPPRVRPDLASAALFIVIGLALVVLGIVNLRRSREN